MSKIDKMLKTTCTSPDLFVDLNEKIAETISGGVETFTITNNIDNSITYYIDGAEYTQEPDSTIRWATTGTGKVEFDYSFESGYQGITWDLIDGSANEFQYDSATSNPYDFDLFLYQL